MYVTLQSPNPLVLVRYQLIPLLFPQYQFIHHILHYHKKNDERQNASLSHFGIYCYGAR
jgi:hypothetical protein